MIRSWVKHCGLRAQSLSSLGFVSHGRLVKLNHGELMRLRFGDMGVGEVVNSLKARGFAHTFEVEPSDEAERCTVALLTNLKLTGNRFKGWTAFLLVTHEDGIFRHHVVFAFRNDDDAFKARLALQ